MKNINIPFEDAEIEEIIKVKNGLTWRVYILALTRYYKKHNGRKSIMEELELHGRT